MSGGQGLEHVAVAAVGGGSEKARGVRGEGSGGGQLSALVGSLGSRTVELEPLRFCETSLRQN